MARRTSTYLSDPQSHEPEFEYSDFSHSKIEKGNAQFPVHLGNSPDEDSIKAGGVIPEGFDEETKKRACYFSLVSALDKNPDTKYKAYNYLKHHHDRIYVSDLPAAQELLAFLKRPTAEYHVTTSLCRVPHEDSRCRKGMGMLLWNKNERERERKKNIATTRSQHSQPQDTAVRNEKPLETLSDKKSSARDSAVHIQVFFKHRRGVGRKPKQ